ncbi:MAG: hypothetical protein AB7S26_08200 [Sandaracinaceae bacterium]
MDEDLRAIQPIPTKMFVLAFVAGGACALLLSLYVIHLENQAAEAAPDVPEAAATAGGGELDPAVREQLHALDDQRPDWLAPRGEPTSGESTSDEPISGQAPATESEAPEAAAATSAQAQGEGAEGEGAEGDEAEGEGAEGEEAPL